MSAHLSTLRRHAQQQGLHIECLTSKGAKRYAVFRADYGALRPSVVLWYRTLGEVGAALRVPEAVSS